MLVFQRLTVTLGAIFIDAEYMVGVPVGSGESHCCKELFEETR